MNANIPLNQKRFLAALGHGEALLSLENAHLKIVPLQLNLETIQFWQPDLQWREWKKHLHAGGRIICAKAALSILKIAKYSYENETCSDTQYRDALLIINEWINLQNKENIERVRQLNESLKTFRHMDKISGKTQFAIDTVMEIVSIVEEPNFAAGLRRSLWSTYLSLIDFGSFELDEMTRKQMFDAIRETIFHHYSTVPESH